jgi:hypothetical protein
MDRTDRKWYRAIAGNGGSVNLLGICLRSVTDPDMDVDILIQGFYSTEFHDQYGSENPAVPLFISDAAAGNVSETVPITSGDIARLIGHCFWNIGTHPNGLCIIRFNPDNNWIEI